MDESPTVPPSLSPGDRIAVLAPSGPPPEEKVEEGKALIRQQGWVPVDRRDTATARGYLAGPDASRAADLAAALSDPSIRAVWAARGGYGAMRILSDVPWARLTQDPKWLIGFSDATALHAAANRHGVASVHGPLVSTLPDTSPEARKALWALLKGSPPPEEHVFTDMTGISGGTAEGRLVGGNLSLLTAAIGTGYLPSWEGSILFLEEVGEEPYRIDRMLTQLELAGVAQAVRGVLVGTMTRCDDPSHEVTVDKVLSERLARWRAPVCTGLPAGHSSENRPLALLGTASVDADHGQVRLSPPH